MFLLADCTHLDVDSQHGIGVIFDSQFPILYSLFDSHLLYIVYPAVHTSSYPIFKPHTVYKPVRWLIKDITVSHCSFYHINIMTKYSKDEVDG